MEELNVPIVFIDKKLRPIILRLSKEGYKTTGCCSGHNRFREAYEGYIAIEGVYSDKQISNLLPELEVVKIRYPRWKEPAETLVVFKDLGGPRQCDKDILHFYSSYESYNPLLFPLFYRNLERVGFHHLSREVRAISLAFSVSLQGREVTKGESLTWKNLKGQR